MLKGGRDVDRILVFVRVCRCMQLDKCLGDAYLALMYLQNREITYDILEMVNHGLGGNISGHLLPDSSNLICIISLAGHPHNVVHVGLRM